MSALTASDSTASDRALPLLCDPAEGRGPGTVVVHAGTLRRWLVGSAEFPPVVDDGAEHNGDTGRHIHDTATLPHFI